MIQQGMDNNTCGQRKCQQVRHRICRGKVQGRICLICLKVESIGGGEHTRDVVYLAKAVVGYVGGHGEVGQVPGVGVVKNGGKDTEEENETAEDMKFGPPGYCEGVMRCDETGSVEGYGGTYP